MTAPPARAVVPIASFAEHGKCRRDQLLQADCQFRPDLALTHDCDLFGHRCTACQPVPGAIREKVIIPLRRSALCVEGRPDQIRFVPGIDSPAWPLLPVHFTVFCELDRGSTPCPATGIDQNPVLVFVRYLFKLELQLSFPCGGRKPSKKSRTKRGLRGASRSLLTSGSRYEGHGRDFENFLWLSYAIQINTANLSTA